MTTWILLLQLANGGIGVLDMPSKAACYEAIEQVNSAAPHLMPLLRLHDGRRMLILSAIECRPPVDETVPAS